MVPVVYFFYPETAYRSLEEVDTIYRKTKGWLDIVSIAANEPLRYGKHGEFLIDYEETEEHILRTRSLAGDNKVETHGHVENGVMTGHSNSETEKNNGLNSNYEKPAFV